MILPTRLRRPLGWPALILATFLALPAQAQQCVSGGSETDPFPLYSILIGSTVSCDSVSEGDPNAPSFEGCSIPIGDFSGGTASCTVTFGDERDPVTVDATLDAEGLVSFSTSDNRNVIQVVNTEGATGGNNCGFGYGLGSGSGLDLGHRKNNGQVTGLRSVNFCTNGIATTPVVNVDEEDLDDCSDLLSNGVPARHAAFVVNVDDLTYAGACFGPNTSGVGGLAAVTQDEIIDEACLDRCEPCDDGDDPERCEHRDVSGDNLSSLNCELSGNWSCPTQADCDWSPRPGVTLPYCWEVIADPTESGTYRRTQYQRGSYDARLGPVTTTNPLCFSYYVAGTQRTRCY